MFHLFELFDDRHDAPPNLNPNLRHFQSSEIQNKDSCIQTATFGKGGKVSAKYMLVTNSWSIGQFYIQVGGWSDPYT